MDFTYSPSSSTSATARALADDIKVHELACEEQNGLPADVHARVASASSPPACTPSTCRPSGAAPGLTILEQVVVQEQLGRLTGALVGHGLAAGQRAARVHEAQRER